MNNYKVYYHKVPSEISGYSYDKYYIGISCRKNLVDRWGKNGNGYKNQYFYKAIKKYGWENIEHKILLENLNAETAKNLEVLLINELHSGIKDKGYNITTGGDGVKSSDQIRCHPVYCKELNMMFRTSEIASVYTEDKATNISKKCQNKIPGKSLKFTYCFIEDMRKLYREGNMSHSSKPVVYIKTGELFGSYNIANIILNKNFSHRTLIDYKGYLKRKNNGSIYTKDYLMYADEYVRFFDMTLDKNSEKTNKN